MDQAATSLITALAARFQEEASAKSLLGPGISLSQADFYTLLRESIEQALKRPQHNELKTFILKRFDKYAAKVWNE